MAQILVRNLDPEAVKRLKKRARDGGRSLQAEAKMILEQAANATTLDMDRARELADRIRRELKGRKMTNSVDLIREDRER